MALFKLSLEVYAKRITANMSFKKMKSLLLIARFLFFFFLCQSLVLSKKRMHSTYSKDEEYTQITEAHRS